MDLANRLEAAAKAVYDANPVSGLGSYAGQTTAERTLPSVVFFAERGDEFPQASGNFRMTLAIRVESGLDVTSLENHRTWFSGVVERFNDSAISASLTSVVADFAVMGVYGPEFTENVEDRAFVSELRLQAYCCGTDL